MLFLPKNRALKIQITNFIAISSQKSIIDIIPKKKIIQNFFIEEVATKYPGIIHKRINQKIARAVYLEDNNQVKYSPKYRHYITKNSNTTYNYLLKNRYNNGFNNGHSN